MIDSKTERERERKKGVDPPNNPKRRHGDGPEL